MEYVKQQLVNIEEEEDIEKQSLLQLLLKSCSPKDACVIAVDNMAAGIDTVS